VVELKYRTFWRRVLAGMVDGAVFWPLSFINSRMYGGSTPTALRVAWFLAYSFLFMAYSIALHARFGQTIGKMVAGVRVLDVSEAKLSLKQAFLRDIIPLVLTLVSLPVELPKVLSGANPALPEYTDPGLWLQLWVPLGWFLAEVVTMVTNSKRRALHDFIAGSVVVRTGGVASVEHRDAAAV
jgi:uncharacterized RDD family membrane protein YckC